MKQETHVYHLHVALLQIVAILMVSLHVLVLRVILVAHQTAVLNVFLTKTV